MKNRKTGLAVALLLVLVLVLTGCSTENKTETSAQPAADAKFTPSLDTQKAVEIQMTSFFGNFEALDQVINHFNEFYPNVAVTYEQFNNKAAAEYLSANSRFDIFMTDAINLYSDPASENYVADRCADLLAAGVDVSGVADGLLRSSMVDGKLLRLPMGLSLKGLVVNKTLLEKEGLQVPQTWQEFLDVLEALKQKGYTPVQGPNSAIYNLCYDMVMTQLCNDFALFTAVNSGDTAGAAKLKTVFERMQTLCDKGYISQEVNAAYPENNYDGAILNFFEGNVPFWVCDTEKVSGMKKRESKSEAFSASPFEYEFMFCPMGDNGVYEYIDPWYGFSVNKDSDVYDYAVEFLRFMARPDELNTLASVKGVPSIAKESADTRYAGLSKVEKVEANCVSDGAMPSYMSEQLNNTVCEMLSGQLTGADAALAYLVTGCTEAAQSAQ